MTRTPHRKIARGAALPLALILLGVLTVVATAAVSLSSRDRVNAAAYSKMDAIYACATAATAKFWAELAAQGSAVLGDTSTLTITAITLPDGTRLKAPAHYPSGSSSSGLGSSVGGTGGGTGPGEVNAGPAIIVPGQPYSFPAHCVDASGRELEVEIGVRFEI